MSVATIKRRIAVLVATPIAAGGLTLAGAAPAQAACTANTYVVSRPVAGVYAQPSDEASPITSKNRGDRVTGPSELAHVRRGRHTWTGVSLDSASTSGRRGWMHADDLTFTGCS